MLHCHSYTPLPIASRLVLTTDVLAPGASYLFTMNVSLPFLGTSASVSQSVTVANGSLPSVVIDGGSTQNITANTLLTLTAEGGSPATCAAAQGPQGPTGPPSNGTFENERWYGPLDCPFEVPN